jgi:hypothetical protein
VVGEMQRAEMRKMVRELPNETERNKYAIEHADDPAFVAAVIHAPAGLSGLSPSTHGLLRDGQIEREHGEAIAELGDLEEVARVARKAVRNARSKLQEIVGVGPEVFEKIAIVAEKNGGKLPFRVDVEQAPNGQPIEVARVFDLESKQWRRATAEEIQASANDAAAA